MRKPLALLGAAAIIIALVVRWTPWDFAVSIVPGWHTPIFSSWFVSLWFVAEVLLSAVLLLAALAILVRPGGWSRSRKP